MIKTKASSTLVEAWPTSKFHITWHSLDAHDSQVIMRSIHAGSRLAFPEYSSVNDQQKFDSTGHQ